MKYRGGSRSVAKFKEKKKEQLPNSQRSLTIEVNKNLKKLPQNLPLVTFLHKFCYTPDSTYVTAHDLIDCYSIVLAPGKVTPSQPDEQCFQQTHIGLQPPDHLPTNSVRKKTTCLWIFFNIFKVFKDFVGLFFSGFFKVLGKFFGSFQGFPMFNWQDRDIK